jgi:hypothetical protein
VNINFNYSLPTSSRMRFTSRAQGGWTVVVVVVVGAFGEGNLPASSSTPLQESSRLLRDLPVHSGIRLQVLIGDRALQLLPLCVHKITSTLSTQALFTNSEHLFPKTTYTLSTAISCTNTPLTGLCLRLPPSYLSSDWTASHYAKN